MKKITLLLLMVSLFVPMALNAQGKLAIVKKADMGITKGDRNKSTNVLATRTNGMAPQAIDVQFGAKNNLRALARRVSDSAITWDFESEEQLADWTIVDNDGDGFNWEYYNNEGLETGRMTAHEGNGLVSSKSYDNDGVGVLYPDNWLISPEVTLGGGLTFWACGQDPSYAAEVFAVYVCVGDPSDLSNFVQVGTDKTATGDMTLYEFDLSEYAGQTGYFAIRHYNVYDMFMLNIDDVTLDPELTIVPEPTLPENLTVNPAATTADVTWEDNDDSSWNLRYREYNPNAKQYLSWDLEDISQLEDWSIFDADNDGYNWGYTSSDELAHSGEYILYSISWSNNTGELNPDNWLISPRVKLDGTLSFWARSYTDSFPDNFGVYVAVGEDLDNLIQVGEDEVAPQEWTEYTYDLSEFAGQTGYFIIRHYNSENEYYLFIDDITLDVPGDEPAEWVYVNDLSETEYTIEDLTPATDYEVQVQAFNEEGQTDWTESTIFTTPVVVNVSAVGYATLYYGEKNLVVPENMDAHTITVEGGNMTKSHTYAAGDIIPQGTGVLLQAEQGEYEFAVTTEEGETAENMLRGSDEAEETTGGDVYLMLSLNAKNDPASVGFYYGAGCSNGEAFINGAHKAYLALTAEQAAGVNCFLFDGIASGISNIENTTPVSEDIYTVSGVRVNKQAQLPKGIYVVGGKKVVVK
jgi:hypothetical protein